MGIIISIAEYKKKRCIDALIQHIGLPQYCDECGGGDEFDDFAEYTDFDENDLYTLSAEASGPAISATYTQPRPAQIIPFPAKPKKRARK